MLKFLGKVLKWMWDNPNNTAFWVSLVGSLITSGKASVFWFLACTLFFITATIEDTRNKILQELRK